MKEEIGKRIGHRIKVRRVDLRMNQGDLAQALGISQGYLSDLERGDKRIYVEMLEQIAEVLQCSMTELLDEKEVA